MARVLKLTDGTITVDFLSGCLKLQAGGWGTSDGGGAEGRESALIWETLELVADTPDANIRADKINLDTLKKTARLYKSNPLRSTAVWFYWNSDGEIERRALVYDIACEMQTDEIFGGPLLGGDVALLRVAIQRAAEYEDSSPTVIDLGAIDIHGGIVALPDIGGTIEGRISKAAITSASGQLISRVWLGLRPVYETTVGFTAKWEAEDGTPQYNASVVSNTFASGGNAVSVPFTDFNDFSASRLTINLDQVVGGNANGFVGKYLLLGVLNVDVQATEVHVQLRHGWKGFISAATAYQVLSDMYIGGTSEDVKWRLRELGVIEIPPTGNRDQVATVGGLLSDYTVAVYAERLSVAGSLLIDGFILVPADHQFTADGCNMTSGGGEVDAYTAPNEEQYAIGENPSGAVQMVEYSFDNWKYPVGGGLVVLAADTRGSLEPAWTETANVALTVYPRWTSYNDGTSPT